MLSATFGLITDTSHDSLNYYKTFMELYWLTYMTEMRNNFRVTNVEDPSVLADIALFQHQFPNNPRHRIKLKDWSTLATLLLE